MSRTTCSMPFDPCGDSAGAALAAVWDKSSAPVRATPVEAPMSWRKLRRVSIGQYEPSFRYQTRNHK
jgi:hypothetical protein